MKESRKTVLSAIWQTGFGSHPFRFSPILSVILPPLIQMSDTETAADSKKVSVPTFVSPIAKPLAGKSQEREGVFVAVKWIRRRIMVLAANIAPMDVISHIPILCEEKGIPYIFVSSKVGIAVKCLVVGGPR